MKDTKVQWHPGFVAAMGLEFSKNRDELIFESEYNLNKKPLEIDLLVIKKEPAAHVENEIGKLFKGHNILEYKSPEDHLDIDTFYKAGAYASLYKSYGETVDLIKADDVTVTIIRESKPIELFHYFKQNGYSVTSPYKGIYYIEGKVLFPTQIIVTRELAGLAHIWLRALSEKLKRQDIEELLENIRNLSGKMDRELADSVLEVSIGANRQVVEELIRGENMSKALMEIMEPQLLIREKKGLEQGIKQGREQGVKQGLQQGIQGAAEFLKQFGYGDAEIKTMVMEKYNLSEEEVGEYL